MSILLVTNASHVVIFPMLSKSQLLNAAKIATVLKEDGYKVTIMIPENDLPDIKPSSKFNVISYPTDMAREKEQLVLKEMPTATPQNLLFGNMNISLPEIFGSRCRAILNDKRTFDVLSNIQPDIAIVHSVMACVIPQLQRLSVPFLDFCSVPLVPFLCGGPHRIPGPPSYVPATMFQSNDHMSFFGRVLNTILLAVAPFALKATFLKEQADVIYNFQKMQNLPVKNYEELRADASFLLVHGDITFESIRPLTPKVIHIGGIQCNKPQPFEDEDIASFVDGISEVSGLIVFTLGGALNTDVLPPKFIENFFHIFADLPQKVIWRLKSVPEQLRDKIPTNVKIVNWMPQQDLLGHPKTKLFISHGGIQGSFEAIFHGKPMLGVAVAGDQRANLEILQKKGMALIVDDYTTMDVKEVRLQINELLSNADYLKNAREAQALFLDQPLSPAQRLKWAVGYTLRHAGAKHLTSQAAMELHWIQYYLIDVMLFLVLMILLTFAMTIFCFKKCSSCKSDKIKKE